MAEAADWKLPWSASCLCGQVRMTVSAAPVIAMACHCRGCQKLSGGPYSLTLMIPADGFAAEGETVLGGLHRDESPHHHCSHCKNWLFTTNIGGGQFVNFRPTMLDDASWVRPLVESFVGDKLPGVESGARHSFEAFPPREAFGSLMQEFDTDAVRPGRQTK